MLDRQWESLQARFPVLYHLDNSDWKTWCLHALLTVGAGQVSAWAFEVDPAAAMRFFVFAYFVREIWNRLDFKPLQFAYWYKPLDGVMDVLVPLVVVEALIRA